MRNLKECWTRKDKCLRFDHDTFGYLEKIEKQESVILQMEKVAYTQH